MCILLPHRQIPERVEMCGDYIEINICVDVSKTNICVDGITENIYLHSINRNIYLPHSCQYFYTYEQL
jgi:hypothetical protein